MWAQQGNGLFHGACGLHDLWQEHLSLPEELADLVHTVHERSLDYVDSLREDGQRLGDIICYPCGNALSQGVCKSVMQW